jgi:hypothetical protein
MLVPLFAEAMQSTNPVSRIATPNLGNALDNRLRAIASVRELRIAVQRALGEPVTPLPDPGGGWLPKDGEAGAGAPAARR